MINIKRKQFGQDDLVTHLWKELLMQRYLLQNAMSFESNKALLFLNNLGENSQLSLHNLTLALIVLASQKRAHRRFLS